jgi:hypothetical protein
VGATVVGLSLDLTVEAATPPTAATATAPMSILSRKPDEKMPRIAARRVRRVAFVEAMAVWEYCCKPQDAQKLVPLTRTAASPLHNTHCSSIRSFRTTLLPTIMHDYVSHINHYSVWSTPS